MLLDQQTLEITIITQILYILKVYEHVGLVKNISNVVVNNSQSPENKGIASFSLHRQKFNIL